MYRCQTRNTVITIDLIYHPWWRHQMESFSALLALTLKHKCRHFDEIFITGCTESCQNDNFRCSQWLKFHQNDNISFSVNLCGEFTGYRWIPHTKASDAELWCFLWSTLNKPLSKQSWCWRFETPSCSLCIWAYQGLIAGGQRQRIGDGVIAHLDWAIHM